MSKQISPGSIGARTVSYYFRLFMNSKVVVAINILSALLAVLVGTIYFRYLLASLFQELAGFKTGDDPRILYEAGLWLCVVSVAEMSFWRINDFAAIFRHRENLKKLEQEVFDKLIGHSYQFFSNKFAGSLITQFNRFLRGYHELDKIIIFDIITTLVNIVSATVVLFVIAPPMGAYLLVWSLVFLSSMIYLARKKAPLTRAEAEADSYVTAVVADVLTNIMNVKTFGRSDYEKQRFAKVVQKRADIRRKSWHRAAHIRTFRWILILIFICSYVMGSIYLVVNELADIGVVLAAQLYMIAIYQQLFNFHQVIERVEVHLGEATEMMEIIDANHDVVDVENPEPAVIKRGDIEFREVKFEYPDARSHVFKRLNLHIKPGEKIGLVGPSGGGKTTLTRLLLRFADVQEGTIAIDGQNISRIAQEELRRNIAYVAQEPILFHRTLRENIAYGKPDAAFAEIKHAARLARADGFINQLSGGYDTLVGERGIKLSGGEKQRVAIARAMLSKAPILLLDEATSALDSKSEKLITQALDELMKHRTTIVVAHRLSTIKKMDRILVMEKGSIIEDGSHRELIELKGKYAELWSHQSGDFLRE